MLAERQMDIENRMNMHLSCIAQALKKKVATVRSSHFMNQSLFLSSAGD